MVAFLCVKAGAEEPVTFQTHEKSAWRIAVTPDGETLFTATHTDDTMRMWDLATKKLIREFPDISGGLSSIECSPDGKVVLTGSWGNMVRLWDIETGEKLRQIKVPAAPVTCATFSPDGETIAAVVKDHHLVYIYSTESGELKHTLTMPMEAPAEGSGGLASACFTPDGKLLLTACGGRGYPKYTGEDSVIAIWNTETWEMHATLPADKHNVYCLLVSPDGKQIAAACHRSQYVKVWRMPEEDEKPEKEGDEDERIAALIKDLDNDDFGTREGAEAKLRAIGAPASDALKKVVESGEAEAQFRARKILRAIGEVEEADPFRKLDIKGLDIHSIAFSPDGKYLASGSSVKAKRNFILWNTETYKPVVTPDKTGSWAVAFTPDGEQIITGNSDGTVTVWDKATLLGE